MKRAMVGIVVLMAGVVMTMAAAETRAGDFFPKLAAELRARVGEFDRISEERRALLERIADHVKRQIAKGEPVRLTFICTHNSRRSHLAQVWASAAARYYALGPVETYSGGTEATAFNPRAVAALERAGIAVARLPDGAGDSGKNPRYAVRFAADDEPMVCFSKVYDAPPNPSAGFCAVMTCSEADRSCPVVKGSVLRVGLPYEDPKASDGMPEEARTYDERSRQISREMLYLFSQVASGKRQAD